MISLTLCRVIRIAALGILIGGMAGQALAQDAPAAAPNAAAPRRTGLTIVINDGQPVSAPPDAVTISGSTNAPAGSAVTVSIGGASQQATVSDDGSWSVTWPPGLPVGRYTVEASVRSQDGRTGSTRENLVVGTPGAESQQAPQAGPVPAPVGRAASDDFQATTDRWRLTPPPYELNATPGRWNPYEQRTIKGDRPIRGNNLFLVLTGVSDTLIEARTLPTPAGASTANTDLDFFGGDQQLFAVETLLGSIDLFKGDTAFRPIDWRLKATIAANVNYLKVEENGVVNPDVRRGTDRTDEAIAIQELFYEQKIANVSPNFDFVSFRIGVQPFTSDFRGFIFSDQNLGFRLFGNFRSNRYQYNVAYFDRLEKDTNSGLNTLEFRDQRVAIANIYRQDTFAKGHTVELSVHYLKDDATFAFDENGFLARPDATGSFTPHGIEATYLGFASLGHAGPVNIDSALYYVFGEDELNPIAGRELVLGSDGFKFVDKVDIRAWMAALELSIDKDWLRPRLAFFVTSGDDEINDRKATGFDSIFDNPNFAGGGFSFFNRAGIRLAGSNVALVNRGSLLPDLTSSKEEGQPNFVNPGLQLGSLGLDLDLTPKTRMVLTANYLRFAETAVLEGLLFQAPIRKDIGWDLSAGIRYRPFLNQNFVVLFGAATLLPGNGYGDIYEKKDPLYQAFTNLTFTY